MRAFSFVTFQPRDNPMIATSGTFGFSCPGLSDRVFNQTIHVHSQVGLWSLTERSRLVR